MGCEHSCGLKAGSATEVECFCNDGFEPGTDGKTCSDINECNGNTHKCDVTCINTDGSYNCSCNDGYSLNDDMRTCRLCPAGQWGAQCMKLCNCKTPDTICDLTFGCEECPIGFYDGDCSTDINECDTKPCDSRSVCVNTPGTFRCDCEEGYTQFNAITCKEVDECESDPCQNGGTCQDESKKYSCYCLDGYNGNNCETDINECDSSPCQNGGKCFDLENRYRCRCKRGFTGINSEGDTDECTSDPCINGAKCIDVVNGYSCEVTTTTPMTTTSTPAIQLADQARVRVTISGNRSTHFSDTGKHLRNICGINWQKHICASLVMSATWTTVVFQRTTSTLKDLLTEELGEGNFDIVDVSFRGSIVVNYEVAVKKATAAETLNTIVDTVKKTASGGSFGNFTVDPTSIKI
ncbi:hypothetical protein LSAT2_027169 [Lamellibrachia satsuma]|nr:hypothetical protein LSAT2_027169 [Lamellibrachia satsuma]